ncbi:MAG TPA: DUF748 domain-containing protein, partial [Planctomycetota bacterium]|nr:DUF748 domain-containing protein [Planctomycetota bacterium]
MADSMTPRPNADSSRPVAPPPAPPPPPAAVVAVRPRRRIWPKVLLGVLALVVVALIVLPFAIRPIVRAKAKEAVEAHLDGTVDLDGFSFMWPADVTVDDFVLRDRRGETVVTADRLTVDVGLLALLSRSVRAEVVLERPKIYVREEADGRFNVQKLMKARPPQAAEPAPRPAPPSDSPTPRTSPPSQPAPKAEPMDAPELKADVRLVDGEVTVALRDGRTVRIPEVDLEIDVDGLDRPAPFSVALRTDRGGAVRANGAVTVAHGGKIDPERLEGRVNYEVRGLPLGEWAPLAAKYGEIERLEGVVEGAGAYEFVGRAVVGKGDLAVTRLDVLGGAVGARPLAIQAVVLKNDVSLDGDGFGRVDAAFAADDLARLDLNARIERAAEAGARRVAATLKGGADFAKASAAAPGLLRLKEGYRLEGGATVDGSVDATHAADGLAAAFAKLGVRLERLAVFDASGRALPIDREATLDVEASQARGGPAELKTAKVRMGSITADAGGSYDAARRTVGPSFLKADADLDDLSRKLHSFLDLPTAFGGRIHVDARVEGEGSTARSTSKVTVADLRTSSKDGKTVGPLDVVLEQAARLDLAPGGTTVLESLTLTSAPLEVRASGKIVDLADAARRAGDLAATVKADPAALQRTLGAFFSGYAIAGAPLTAEVRAAVSPDATRVDGAADGRGFALTGPALGPEGFRVAALDLAFDASADPKAERFDLSRLQLTARDLAVQMKDAPEPIRSRELALTAAGRRTGADAELRSLDLRSDFATAQGSGRVVGIGRPGMTAAGEIAARGDVAPLFELVRGMKPEYRDARAGGAWRLAVKASGAGTDLTLTSDVEVDGLSLVGVQAAGKDLAVRDARVALKADATLRTDGAGAADLRSVRLDAPGVSMTANGKASNFLGDGAKPETTLAVAADLDPEELNRRLGAFLAGYETGGSPVKLRADVALAGNTTTIHGRLDGPSVRIVLPPDPSAPPDAPAAGPRTIVQDDLAVAFDVVKGGTPEAPTLDVRTATFASRTATASAKGRVAGTGYGDADLALTARAQLADVQRDLGAFLPKKDMELRGATSLDATLKGRGDRAKLAGELTVADFFVSAPGDRHGERKTATDPKVAVRFDVDTQPQASSYEIHRLEMASSFLWGTASGRIHDVAAEPTFAGVKGDFTYHPDRLGAVLQPWLPGELQGTEHKKVVFNLDGKAVATDWVSVLRGADGAMSASVAKYVMPAFDLFGDMRLTVKNERLDSTGLLKLNGGDLSLQSGLDLRRTPDAVSKVTLQLAGAKANGEMSPLLQLVNPVFALDGLGSGARASDGGGGGLSDFLTGLLDLKVDLTYSGRIDADTFTRGVTNIPFRNIDGAGRIGFSNVAVKGSSLLGVLAGALFSNGLAALGQGGTGGSRLELEPITFTIRKGRLHYDRPLKMTIAGVKTEWNGSIGLDKSLDMWLEVPITEKLVAKHTVLGALVGTSFRVPLAGDAGKPQLRMDEAMQNLLQDAAKSALERAAGDLLKDKLPIPGLGGDKPVPVPLPVPLPGGRTDPPAPQPQPQPQPQPGTSPQGPGTTPQGPARPTPSPTPTPGRDDDPPRTGPRRPVLTGPPPAQPDPTPTPTPPTPGTAPQGAGTPPQGPARPTPPAPTPPAPTPGRRDDDAPRTPRRPNPTAPAPAPTPEPATRPAPQPEPARPAPETRPPRPTPQPQPRPQTPQREEPREDPRPQVPSTVTRTAPSGTTLALRLNETISTETSSVG